MEIKSRVLKNALAKNATMFKVGDKVVYDGADPKAYKRDGIVKSIEEKNGKPQLTIELDNGETFTAPTDDWARRFANSMAACNDKWIDDFHVIVTAEKPDPALVDALKKKAAAWKAYKRNFSDKAADEAHEKAKHEVATVAKRLGAKLEQIGAVLRVVMPNAVAANFNYKNKYQWFVVTPSMSGACILAGNEYREDAQEVFKEIKDEEGISCKVVARRTLERAGIDPNVSESWAKGIRKAVANAACNAKFHVGQRVKLTDRALYWHGKNLKDVVGTIEKLYDYGEYADLFVPAYWIGGELGRELAKTPVREGSKDVSRRIEEGELVAANAAISSKVARNAMGRDKQDAASVDTWLAAFRNTIEDAFPKFKDKIRAEALGEKVIKEIESRAKSEGGKAQLAKEGWTIPKLREALKKALEKVGTNAMKTNKLPSELVRTEEELKKALAKYGAKLEEQSSGYRTLWTLRRKDGSVIWQESFAGDYDSYDRAFRGIKSYLNTPSVFNSRVCNSCALQSKVAQNAVGINGNIEVTIYPRWKKGVPPRRFDSVSKAREYVKREYDAEIDLPRSEEDDFATADIITTLTGNHVRIGLVQAL